MKIAFFSDIHGNKEALTAIINDIKKEKIDEVICLGDIIGIGPNPKECLDIIIDNNISTVLGNHELYFLKGTEIDVKMGENEVKHQKWIKSQITSRQKKYLENCNIVLEREYNGKKVLFEHFFIENNNALYPFFDLKIIKDEGFKEFIKSSDYDLIFIGHEHNTFCLDNKVYDIGSSGCTKDNFTKYTIFDTSTFEVEIKNIEYDRKNFEQSILKCDYPDRNLIAKWFFGIEIQ